MDRAKISDSFYIEQHALLFALLVKHAVKHAENEGWKISGNATKIYGQERGLRMAMRTVRDNEELTPLNFLVYGECADPKGISKSLPASLAPDYLLNVVKCGWNDSWHKHGLQEYGRIYCQQIDQSIIRGFNPEIKLSIDKFLSLGDSCCNFQWIGVCFDSLEEQNLYLAKRTERIERIVKDFLFHCGHLLWSMRRVYLMAFGYEKGINIVNDALLEFSSKFGVDMTEAICEESHQDFLTI